MPSNAATARSRTRPTEKAAYWLDFCRRYMVKQADLGGDGQDIPFEQAFANLAHAYLKDKAPGLLDYQVGFQLVDRNEDNSKAIGIFGFKVGSQWLYAPVFFLNGDLKGHELLYVKNQDTFVPLKENWINYLLNKKPVSLGGGVNKDTRLLGVRQPDLARIVHSPASTKLASWLPPWLADAMPGLAYAAMIDPYRDTRYSGLATLPEVVKAAGVRGVRCLAALTEAYPTLAAPLEAFYGDALPAAMAEVGRDHREKRAAARSLLSPATPPPRPASPPGRLVGPEPPDHPVKAGSLTTITYDHGRDMALEGLTDDERTRLRADGIVVRDGRPDDQVSRAFRGDVPVVSNRGLMNPDETGLYDILIKPGAVEKCLVIYGPHGPNGRRNYAVVVRAGGAPGERGWLAVHPSWVWATRRHGDDEFRAFLKDAGDPSAEGPSTAEGKQFIALGPDGSGTLPFIVEGEVGGPDDGYRIFKVRFDLYCDRPRANAFGTSPERWDAIEMARNDERWDRWAHGERIHCGGRRGTRLRSSAGDVYIPKDFLIVEVEPAEYEEDQWKAPEFEKENFKRNVMSITGGQGKSKNPPTTAMSNNPDADLGIYAKTAAMRVHFDGAGGHVDGGPYMGRTALLRELIEGRGFREKVARQILGECEDGRYKIGGATKTYRVAYAPWCKQAAPGDYGGAGLTMQGPSAPSFPDPPYGSDDVMGSNLPMAGPQQMAQAVPGMRADPGNRDAYLPLAGPDPMAAQAVGQASRTGQREIFDTAAVGSLLKTTQDDQLTDRFLGDLMKGLDRIGRILFMLYWHQDQFQDRYGKTEIPELEDSLRGSFEDVGDLVLFLKQKSVQPDPEAETQHIDLKDAAG
jgi:hypothetical protein